MRPFLYSTLLKKDVYSCILVHLDGEKEIDTSLLADWLPVVQTRMLFLFWTSKFSG